MYGFSTLGKHFDFSKNNNIKFEIKQNLSINFAVVKIGITYVDQLFLDKHIHSERRCIINEEWFEERINP
tara:strand:- start:260 stop:469 length:210 start_codon:yes stop_codon:yes gene_type:complete